MIDHSNYSCDKCKRVGSWHCKHCWHTAEKPPTRFKPKKKTGVQTPEFRKPTPPPPLPTEEFTTPHPRVVKRCCVDTEDRLDVFMTKYNDARKIEGAMVYWSDKYGALAVVASQEWKDYLFDGKDMPIIEKENKQ